MHRNNSQAEKRIILVGDHRQLPHIIDEDIVSAVEGRSGEQDKNENDYVRESMFSYLKSRLLKLDQEQGYKKGRVITLDAQYRTHPLLGDFCSANFYDKHNEGYVSPLTKEKMDEWDAQHRANCNKPSCENCRINSFDVTFGNNLPGTNGCPAIWIDVPHVKGEEIRLDSGSRKRDAEARIIAEYVNKWIGSEEGSRLSFGVISFYKAQVFAVYEALQKFGITERAQDGAWQICQEYRFLENGEERLRIGTVDAFQGMEFDIVFLSMVRSQDMNALPPHIRNEQDYKKKQQKLFGHLMSENRLCVSMSRQKKVLAIVGDGVFANTQIAVDAVPALKNFYDLCHEKGVIL